MSFGFSAGWWVAGIFAGWVGLLLLIGKEKKAHGRHQIIVIINGEEM